MTTHPAPVEAPSCVGRSGLRHRWTRRLHDARLDPQSDRIRRKRHRKWARQHRFVAGLALVLGALILSLALPRLVASASDGDARSGDSSRWTRASRLRKPSFSAWWRRASLPSAGSRTGRPTTSVRWRWRNWRFSGARGWCAEGAARERRGGAARGLGGGPRRPTALGAARSSARAARGRSQPAGGRGCAVLDPKSELSRRRTCYAGACSGLWRTGPSTTNRSGGRSVSRSVLRGAPRRGSRRPGALQLRNSWRPSPLLSRRCRRRSSGFWRRLPLQRRFPPRREVRTQGRGRVLLPDGSRAGSPS